jgi:hypothetical protein
MAGKPVRQSTFDPFGIVNQPPRRATVKCGLHNEAADGYGVRTTQTCAFLQNFVHAPGVGICGRSVDDVCIELYESNQRSKHYNKIL